MGENYLEFQSQVEDYNKEIMATLKDEKNPLREPITDGVFDAKTYFSADPKILWVMKEPYDVQKDPTKGNGGWHISMVYRKGHFGKAVKTWYPIIYVSNGILHGFQKKADMKQIAHDAGLTKIIESIAYINLQKLPSLTGAKTNNSVIKASFKKNDTMLKKQFDILNPDIIIGANTLNIIKENFDLNEVFVAKKSCTSYIMNKKLFIDAKHPAQLKYSQEVYINDILSTVNEWRQRVATECI